MAKSLRWLSTILFVCASASQLLAVDQATNLEPRVLQLFQQRCSQCHHEGERENGANDKKLILDVTVTRLSLSQTVGKDGPAVVIGDPAKSAIYKRVTLPADDKHRMPKSRRNAPKAPLSDQEKELIRRWIVGEKAG